MDKSIFKVEYYIADYDYCEDGEDYIGQVWLNHFVLMTECPTVFFHCNEYHHILVTELPIGEKCDDVSFLSQKLIGPDGNVLARSDYKDIFFDSDFKGRKKGELLFDVGDCVEYMVGHELRKGVIYGLPVEYDEDNNGFDCSDDSYTILEGLEKIPEDLTDNQYILLHEHIPVVDVFKKL